MCVGGLGLFLTAPAESVAIRVVFFDDSERDILRGKEVQETLKGLVEAHNNQRYELKVPINLSVQVSSKTLPKNFREWSVQPTRTPFRSPIRQPTKLQGEHKPQR